MFKEIWVLIPLAPFLLGGFAIWSHHKRKELALMGRHDDGRASDYAAKNEQLEQRVRVLERIITEQRSDLASQIESLRELPTTKLEDLKYDR